MSDYFTGGPSVPSSKPTHPSGFSKKEARTEMKGKGDIPAMVDYIEGNCGPEEGLLGNSESDRSIADGRGAPSMTEKPRGEY